jgi:hypothetical protein
MKAIEVLMKVEGLLDERGRVVSPKNKLEIRPISEANAKKFRELIAAEEGKRTG